MDSERINMGRTEDDSVILTEREAVERAVGFQDDDLTGQLERIIFVHTVE